MKKFLWQLSCSCLLLAGLLPARAYSQVITAGPDSAVVRAAPAPAETKGLSQPGKAALMSAIVPGLGQAYNNSYWKIPIIYATGAVLGYYLKTNHDNYLDFRQAIRVRTDADPDNNTDRFTKDLEDKGRKPEDVLNTLKRGRDTYRRWRDYTIVYSIAAYGLNITEAYVHAHLKGFDISEELSLKVHPNVIQTNTYSFSPAFSLSINLKK